LTRCESARPSLLGLIGLVALDGFDARRRAADAVAEPARSTAATASVATTHRALVAAGHAQDLRIWGGCRCGFRPCCRGVRAPRQAPRDFLNAAPNAAFASPAAAPTCRPEVYDAEAVSEAAAEAVAATCPNGWPPTPVVAMPPPPPPFALLHAPSTALRQSQARAPPPLPSVALPGCWIRGSCCYSCCYRAVVRRRSQRPSRFPRDVAAAVARCPCFPRCVCSPRAVWLATHVHVHAHAHVHVHMRMDGACERARPDPGWLYRRSRARNARGSQCICHVAHLRKAGVVRRGKSPPRTS